MFHQEASVETIKLFNKQVYFLSENPRMEKWFPGTILVHLGDLHYEMGYKGTQCKRHVN